MTVYQSLKYDQMTSIDASTPLTVPPSAAYCVVAPETQAVRWRSDGVVPTTSVGMPVAVGGSWIFEGRSEMLALRVIAQVSGGKLNVMYYG